MKQTRHAWRSRRERKRGAVMIVVMLMLLGVTALALIAIQSTTFEVRASGHLKSAAQTQYVSETGLESALGFVDQVGGAALVQALIQSETTYPPTMAPFEPELPAGKHNYRIYSSDFTVVPVVNREMVGAEQAYVPLFVVDVNDDHLVSKPIAGHRSDGRGNLRFLRATYTSRGRLRVSLS